MINPASRPVDGGTERDAETILQVFIDETTERELPLADEPERDPEADADGRYGWVLPLEDGGRVPILMPGADLAQVRDDRTAQAYCIRVGTDWWWWWKDAVSMVILTEPGRPASIS